MKHKKDHSNLDDFLKDESFVRWIKHNSIKDKTFWEAWLLANPEKESLAKEAAILVRGTRFTPNFLSTTEVEKRWNSLNEILENKEAAKEQVQTIKHRRNFFKVAATIALFVSCAFLFKNYNYNTETIHQTAFGEKQEFLLPDQSTIFLNSNSTIKYSTNNPRKIWLHGEAFFKVKKENTTNTKFWVITNDLQVEVLGTSFNVNSRNEKTKVVLEEGKVKLDFKNGKMKEMIPGDVIAFSAKTSSILEDINIKKTALHTSWKDGVLLFEDTSLEIALQKIAETYGLKVVFEEEKLKSRLITTGIPTENLNICIAALNRSLNINIIESNKVLIIKE